MTMPTLILVPGAYHTSGCYDRLIAQLRPHFPSIETFSLPSVGATSQTVTSMDPDVARIRTAVAAAVEDRSEDVWLVLHSYAGIPGGDAVKGLSAAERRTAGKKGGVSRIVYIAAFAVPEGKSLLSYVNSGPADWVSMSDVDDGTVHVTEENARKVFYHDVADEEDVTKSVAALKPHVVATFLQEATYAAWQHIPSLYLLCDGDLAVPAFIQEAMVAQKEGWLEGKDGWKVVRLDSGHSPFLAYPEKVASILVDEASGAS